jgi:hypothetical protein
MLANQDLCSLVPVEQVVVGQRLRMNDDKGAFMSALNIEQV